MLYWRAYKFGGFETAKIAKLSELRFKSLRPFLHDKKLGIEGLFEPHVFVN